MSDYEPSQSHHWDSFSEPSSPLDQTLERSPSSSPLAFVLSPLGLNLSPFQDLAQIVERVASPQAPAAYTAPSPLSPVTRSPSPELRYPALVPPRSPTIRLVSPLVRTQSLPPRPDSPIDYEGSAQRILQEHPELEEAFNSNESHLRPGTPVPEPLAENQENEPPVPAPVYRPPACIYGHQEHPPQFIQVHTPLGVENRPIDEFYQDSVHHFRTIEQILTVPPIFPSVFPFRFQAPHYITIYPRNQLAALAIGIPPLVACSKAILDNPSADLPLGCIKYDFREGIWKAFTPYNRLIRQAYQRTLVIIEVQDFLDGRRVTTYSYLRFVNRFGADQVFAINQTYNFEDAVRTSPSLLSYSFTPRIPADPFDFVSAYPDDEPL